MRDSSLRGVANFLTKGGKKTPPPGGDPGGFDRKARRTRSSQNARSDQELKRRKVGVFAKPGDSGERTKPRNRMSVKKMANDQHRSKDNYKNGGENDK